MDPPGDIDLQGYSYKPPGKIGKPAGKSLCITSKMMVDQRTRDGRSAQFAFGVKRKRPEGRYFFVVGLVEFGAGWFLLN